MHRRGPRHQRCRGRSFACGQRHRAGDDCPQKRAARTYWCITAAVAPGRLAAQWRKAERATRGGRARSPAPRGAKRTPDAGHRGWTQGWGRLGRQQRRARGIGRRAVLAMCSLQQGNEDLTEEDLPTPCTTAGSRSQWKLPATARYICASSVCVCLRLSLPVDAHLVSCYRPGPLCSVMTVDEVVLRGSHFKREPKGYCLIHYFFIVVLYARSGSCSTARALYFPSFRLGLPVP